jgi:hypothetical protein
MEHISQIIDIFNIEKQNAFHFFLLLKIMNLHKLNFFFSIFGNEYFLYQFLNFPIG